MDNERVYMIMGTDEAGDHDLFATDDLDRALARHIRMLETHTDVGANWLPDSLQGWSAKLPEPE